MRGRCGLLDWERFVKMNDFEVDGLWIGIEGLLEFET